MNEPKKSHFQATFRHLGYLKYNFEKGILYKKYKSLKIKCYSNANYVESLKDRRSIVIYYILHERNHRELKNNPLP